MLKLLVCGQSRLFGALYQSFGAMVAVNVWGIADEETFCWTLAGVPYMYNY